MDFSGIINRLFRQNTDNLLIQLFRYTFVGGAAFIADYLTLYLLTEFCGVHYLVSASLAFLVGLILNYVISTRWVFNPDPQVKKSQEVKTIEFIGYALVGVIGLGLNALIIWLFTSKLGLYYMLSKLISTAIVFLWNFIGRRILMAKTNRMAEKAYNPENHL
ncbi:MAG: GtrA family protein [Muribaculaceae bacterium]|nr:GtrA family protein [Muribaculaceae bacterium]